MSTSVMIEEQHQEGHDGDEDYEEPMGGPTPITQLEVASNCYFLIMKILFYFTKSSFWDLISYVNVCPQY